MIKEDAKYEDDAQPIEIVKAALTYCQLMFLFVVESVGNHGFSGHN